MLEAIGNLILGVFLLFLKGVWWVICKGWFIWLAIILLVLIARIIRAAKEAHYKHKNRDRFAEQDMRRQEKAQEEFAKKEAARVRAEREKAKREEK